MMSIQLSWDILLLKMNMNLFHFYIKHVLVEQVALAIFIEHLIKGRHNIAGEIQYLPISFSENYQEIKKTPEGALEWTTKVLFRNYFDGGS